MKSIKQNIQHGIIFILSIVLFSTTLQSQVNIKAGGGLGILSTVSDFNGTTIEYYNGSRYGVNGGLNFHGKAKLGLSSLNLTGELDYSSLSGKGNSEPGQGLVELSQNVLSLKVGPEFQIGIPVLPMTPYVGANIAMNRFSSEAMFQGVSKISSATYSVQEATRIGFGLTLGTEVSIGPFMSLDFTASYNFMNVFGKEWIDVNPNTDQRIDSYLTLNDSKDPIYAAGDDKHFIANDRSIHSMLFTVSILFGL